IKATLPRRHHAIAGPKDGPPDRGAIPAIEPVSVGEVRRALGTVATGVETMAARAFLLERLRSPHDRRLVRAAARARHDILDQIIDLRRFKEGITAERR